MKVLNDQVARHANKEDDGCGLVGCPATSARQLLVEKAVFSAICYVDLKPVGRL